MGCKNIAAAGHLEVAHKKSDEAHGAPQSSLLMRYRPLACLSAVLVRYRASRYLSAADITSRASRGEGAKLASVARLSANRTLPKEAPPDRVV